MLFLEDVRAHFLHMSKLEHVKQVQRLSRFDELRSIHVSSLWGRLGFSLGFRVEGPTLGHSQISSLSSYSCFSQASL